MRPLTISSSAPEPVRLQPGLDPGATGISKLEALPKAFGVWTQRKGRPIYAKLVAPYRVFYLVDHPTATVYVLDIVHTARETKLAEYRDSSG